MTDTYLFEIIMCEIRFCFAYIFIYTQTHVLSKVLNKHDGVHFFSEDNFWPSHQAY